MSELALETATIIRAGFVTYHTQYKSLTRRAQRNFERRDWQRNQANAVERLDLYTEMVNRTLTDVRRMLAHRESNKPLWMAMKAEYTHLIANRPDTLLAETFFNSVSRRIFSTVGVDQRVEFIASEVLPAPAPSEQTPFICRAYLAVHFDSSRDLVVTLLRDHSFTTPYADIADESAAVAAAIDQAAAGFERIDLVRAIFFRGKSAYLIGRVIYNAEIRPLVLSLRNLDAGVHVDAVLLKEDEISIVFSFAHTYFHVAVDRAPELVSFLKSLMPRKPVSDLWISLGYNRHGKTVLYREILRHMAHSDDKFEIARGTRGMVMIVFTLPTLQLVFKVIKDHFDYPKKSTRRDVMEHYKMVFRHDRGGRLLDAQSFEFLEFDIDRFQPELLAELLDVSADSVQVRDDKVIINFLYTERRVTPLNLYLAEAEPEAAKAAALEYGQAIKELAATNIFPGDLFLKNFGVTRHGRVLFYDYDELCFVTDCNFRRIPPPRNWEDELSDEPWYTVREGDVFPEQFVHFLGLRPELKAVFLEKHSEIVDPQFWRTIKERHEAGILPNIYPYRPHQRLMSQSK